jgi:hypothetical protein
VIIQWDSKTETTIEPVGFAASSVISPMINESKTPERLGNGQTILTDKIDHD